MGLSLKNLTKKIGDVLGGVERQVNPFDHGATYSNPNPAPAQPSRSAPSYQAPSGQQVVGRISGSSLPQSNPQNHPQVVQNVVSNPQDTRNPFEKLWDQVNAYDNGRTWHSVNPRNQSSVLHQATHNGVTNTIGGVAKPLVVAPTQAGVEVGRDAVAVATHNRAAQNASQARLMTDVNETAPVQVGRQVVDMGKAGYNLGFKAPIEDIIGNHPAADTARTAGLGQFNNTVVGQLVKPIERVMGAKATPQQLEQVNIDPNATGAQKWVGDPVAGALGTLGMVYGGTKVLDRTRNYVKTGKPIVTPKKVPATVQFNDSPAPMSSANVNRLNRLNKTAKTQVLTIPQKEERSQLQAKQDAITNAAGETVKLYRSSVDGGKPQNGVVWHSTSSNATTAYGAAQGRATGKIPTIQTSTKTFYNPLDLQRPTPDTLDFVSKVLGYDIRQDLPAPSHPEYARYVQKYLADLTMPDKQLIAEAARKSGHDAMYVSDAGNLGVRNIAELKSSESKPSVTPKTVPVKPLPPGKVNGSAAAQLLHPDKPLGYVDPGDLKSVRNQIAEAGMEKDAVIVNFLKKVDKTFGTNHADTFIANSTRQRSAHAEAQKFFNEHPGLQKAFNGMDDQTYSRFSEYANARRELANSKEKMQTSRPVSELRNIVKTGHAEFNSHFKALNQYFKDLATKQYHEGTMTKEMLDHYNKDNDYIRIARDMSDVQNFRGNSGGGKYSISSSASWMRRTGSKRAAQDPLITALNYTQKIHSELAANRTASHLGRVFKGTGLSRVLANPEDAIFRRKMQQFLSETRPGKVAVARLLRTHSKQLKALNKEMNNLSKRGLNLSLKKDSQGFPDFNVAGLGGKKVGSIKLGARDTASLIRSLITKDPAELARIRKMLSAREPKLAKLVGDVQELQNTNEAFNIARGNAWKAIRLHADESLKNKNTMSFIKNGVKEVHEVPGEIKRVIDEIKPFNLGAPEKILSFPARLTRLVATGVNPVFTAANPLKDQVSAAIVSSNTRATHTARNIGSGLKNAGADFINAPTDPLFNDSFKQVHGDMKLADTTRNIKGSKEITAGLRGGRAEAIRQAFKHPIRSIEDLNSITEVATRFQNFKGIYQDTLRKQGWSDKDIQFASDHPLDFAKQHPEHYQEALQEGYLAALNHTVNFARAGSWGRILNLIIPYSNAPIQGGRVLVNAFKKRPISTPAKGFGFVAMPIAAATVWNTSDPERKKIYENIQPYEKQNNLILIKPGAKYNDVKNGNYKDVYKAPLAPDVGAIFQPVRRFIEAHAGIKGPGIHEIATDVTKPFVGPVDIGSKNGFINSLTPSWVKPSENQMANRDMFTGKQVVPDYVTDSQTDPLKRATPHTSSTARLISQGISKVTGAKVEPLRVDKFITDTTGKVGQFGINTADNILAKTGKAKLDDKGKPIIGGQSIKAAYQQRFGAATAITDPNNKPAAHFTDINNAIKNAGLDKNELSAYNTLHPMKVDGAAPDKTPVDGKLRADIYMKYDKVWKVDQQADAAARKRGEPGNPMFDLNQQQRKALLAIQTSNPGDPDAKILEKDNPWLQDYYKKSSQYFDQVMKQNKKTGVGTTTAPDPIWKTPVASDSVNRAFDAMNQISDSKQRSQFIRDTPELQDYLSRADQATRAKRAWIGLEQFDTYPTADKNTQSLLDQYDSLPQHDGKRGGNKSRYDFIQAHPEISDYFNQVAQYSANEDAKTAMYQGHDNKGSGSGGSSSGSSSGGSSSSSGSSYSSSSKPYVRYSSGSSGGSSGGSLNTQAYVVAAHGQHAASFQSGIKKRTGKKPAVAGKKAITKPKVTIKKSR